ncbi:MAG: hypothetical protein V4497_11505, partial [Bacteroidota bacterium]
IPDDKQNANILKNFKNIKYVSVETAILPYEIVEDLMYITVTLIGVRNDNYYTTTENNRDPLVNLYRCDTISKKYVCFEPYTSQKRYAYIEGEINNLQVIYKDPEGHILGEAPLIRFNDCDKSAVFETNIGASSIG